MIFTYMFDALDYVTEFTFDPNLLDSLPLYIKGVPFKWIHSNIFELLTITKKFSFEGIRKLTVMCGRGDV